MNELKIMRIYDSYISSGYRILVDRLWPRGVAKVKANLDLWSKDIAPSNNLRKWFNHDPKKFLEFAELYRKELEEDNELENFIKIVKEQLAQENVLLLYGAKDEQYNNAVVLKDLLEKQLNKKV